MHLSVDFAFCTWYNVIVEWEEVPFSASKYTEGYEHEHQRYLSTLMSKFRNSSNTRYLQALFFEQSGADKSNVVYTLKDEPHMGYQSLYQHYMTVSDPTEYRFATEWLDGWEHWESLCNCAWFKPIVARWRRELSLKIKSEALASIISESRSTSSNSYQASKFLVNGEWEEGRKTGRGRPSKAEVKQEAQKVADDKFRLADDFKRIQKELH